MRATNIAARTTPTFRPKPDVKSIQKERKIPADAKEDYAKEIKDDDEDDNEWGIPPFLRRSKIK